MERSLFPVTSGNLSITRAGAYSLGYDANSRRWVSLNADAADVLMRCDGQHSVQDIVQEIATERGLPAHELASLVSLLLASLKKDTIISIADSELRIPIRVRSTSAEYPLQTLVIEVTRRCNLSCPHCYNESSPHRTEELAFDDLTRLIDSADLLGVFTVFLTGGEPFFRQDTLLLCEYIRHKGLEFGIFTNGTRIMDRGRLGQLVSLHPKLVAISVDSIDPAIFTRIRGADLADVLATLEYLRSAGVPVRINVTLFPGLNCSYAQLRALLEFFVSRGYGPSQIAVDEIVPVGRGANLGRTGRLEAVVTLKKAWLDVLGETAHASQPYAEASHATYCGIGRTLCYVTSFGAVALCPLLTSEAFCAGSVRLQSLQQIWNTSRLFVDFRQAVAKTGSECSRCAYLPRCGGGCKAKSIVLNGSFAAPDTWQCLYFGARNGMDGS